MRLARILAADGEVFAASADASTWFPLSALGVPCASTAEAMLRLDAIADGLEAPDPALAQKQPQLRCPIVGPTNVIGVALNYRAHAAEVAGKVPSGVPEAPVTFAKYTNSLAGPIDDIILPSAAPSQVDYEVELAVVIKQACRDVGVDDALGMIGAVAVANDVSARDVQFAEGQFSRAKSFDSFCPIGPWLTTLDEVGDLQELVLRCTVSGDVRQDASTSQMIFGVAELVSFLSRDRTLSPGDVILTGTPSGVAMGTEAGAYLRAGDRVVAEIAGVGRLTNTVVAT